VSADRAEQVAAGLRERGIDAPDVAVVLGSGLGAFVERLEDSVQVPFDALDGLPRSTVPGHAGRFVFGRLGGTRVLAQAGRVHLYEGWDAVDVTIAVRAVAALGTPALLLTNAAGGLRPEWDPGTLMRITDHLNLQGVTPLHATERAWGTPWDPGLGDELAAAAEEVGVELAAGVYAALSGPAYETPAEIRLLARIGADAVGMSTACEALAAHAAGMGVAGISCITNQAAGIASGPLDHQEVIETGRLAAERFTALLTHALPRLGRRAAAGRAR
jgi:purine-nucleoside phosphorylase